MAGFENVTNNSRRFPPPWTVDETEGCFIAKSRTGQNLAYVLPRERTGTAIGGDLLTMNEARRIAATIANCLI